METHLLMRKVFGKKIFQILQDIGKVAENGNSTAYLVGGPVRDLFFNKMSKPRTELMRGKDLDIVVSAGENTTKNTAINLAKELFRIWSPHPPLLSHRWTAGEARQKKRGNCLKFKIHQHFGTATIFFPKLQIDFAFSRKEKYAYPGALPEVEPGNIQDDLSRRDFTINSLALELNPDNFGRLLDLTGGLNDLKKKLIRVHHQKSFLDDPTRILRAARFAGRYNFQIERKTLVWLRKAIKKKVFSTISRERFREEMVTILKEKEAGHCLGFLANWDVLKFLHPSLSWNREQIAKVKFADTSENDWLVNLLLLIKNLNYIESEEITKRMVLTREERKVILETKKYLPKVLQALGRNYSLERIYSYLSLLPEQGLIYLELTEPKWKNIIATFCRRKNKARAVINGEDLKKLGFKPGAIYKKILDRVYQEKIVGNLPVNLSKRKIKEKEIKFVTKHFFLA